MGVREQPKGKNMEPTTLPVRTIVSPSALDELAPHTKLLALQTGEVWWVRKRRDGAPLWQGSGGMYTDPWDLVSEQGPMTVIWEPCA